MNLNTTATINPEEEIPFMNIDETDFTSMGRAEQIRHLEVEGFVVFPAILNSSVIASLKSGLADAEMALRVARESRPKLAISKSDAEERVARAKLTWEQAVRDVERRIEKAEEQIDIELPVLEQPQGAPPVFEDHLELMFDLQILAVEDFRELHVAAIGKARVVFDLRAKFQRQSLRHAEQARLGCAVAGSQRDRDMGHDRRHVDDVERLFQAKH